MLNLPLSKNKIPNFLMSVAFAPRLKMSPEDYLRMQRASAREQTEKYEFFNQNLKLIAGGSPNHNEINKNLTFTIEWQIRQQNSKHRVFANDMRTVSYLSYKNYLYPDIVVVDGKPYFDDEKEDNLANPSLTVEVLSDSTEGFDRGDKFSSYRLTPSMKEYVLVSQKEKKIETYYRSEDNEWHFGKIITEGRIQLYNHPFELDIEDLYRNIDFKDPFASAEPL
jgi:Uma2 family endonuclease